MSEANEKRYWKSVEERDAPDFLERADDEFPGPLPPPARQFKRRDFLKAAGFSLAAAVATGCSRAPVEKAIPFLIQPEEIIPGRSLSYATTCGGCSAGCGVLAKMRDGRPIKLEGNPQHALSQGGLCAVGQASPLGLYDSLRFKHPLKDGRKLTWAEIDKDIEAELARIRAEGGAVRFLSETITSPALRAAIGGLLNPFRDARHVTYDPISHSAILDAHAQTHGARALPSYHFERAEVIASFDADFLATWISPVEFTAGYRAGRNLESKPPRMSYHVQFEPRLSVTGSKADRRFAIAPGETGLLLSHLAARLAKKAGADFSPAGVEPSPVDSKFLDDLTEKIWAARGRSLVVCGSQDVREQALTNYLNHLLGNYGATLDLEYPSYQAQGDDRELEALLRELGNGKVRALFVYGVNPAYDLPGGEALAKALRDVPLLVSFAQRADETASLARFVCPDSHYLESWADAELVAGKISVTQPTIRPLHDTRQVVESLAAWSGRPQPAYELLREYWRTSIYPRRTTEQTFDAFWDTAVHDGFVVVKPQVPRPGAAVATFSAAAVQPITTAQRPPADSLQLVLYPKVGLLDGRHAYNPWLQELPDPISKVTWDNYACLSPATAQKLNLNENDVVRIEAPGQRALELPVYIQPGQHDGVVAVALGYGGRLSGRFAKVGPQWLDALPTLGENGLVGKNAAPLLRFADGRLHYSQSVRLTPTGKQQALASTQTHNTLTAPARLTPAGSGPRPIVQETTLAAFLKDPASGVYDHEEKEALWPADHPYTGLRWGMVIDLAACTGCSACVVACQAENNIPVVGKDEIRRNREMHWLRVDRYYSEPAPGQVEVSYQPLSCQQCENAPCETVCPVLATVHSEDGLNVQVYNRCVGTRYCANNCPYKARRFNWFDYRHDDTLQNLVLNPDVTVRSRGVMEKCTFCVQRLQEAKIEAKRQGTRVEDGSVQTACQQSCPARAISFGDLNDPKSQVTQRMKNPRRYRLLSEINTKPAVGYLTVVRNRGVGASPAETGEKKSHG